jgi:hypothetical protein
MSYEVYAAIFIGPREERSISEWNSILGEHVTVFLEKHPEFAVTNCNNFSDEVKIGRMIDDENLNKTEDIVFWSKYELVDISIFAGLLGIEFGGE